MDASVTDSNRRVRTRTHGGVAGVRGRPRPLCRSMLLKTRPRLPGVREVQFEGFLFHAPDTKHVLQTQEWQGTFRIAQGNKDRNHLDWLKC